MREIEIRALPAIPKSKIFETLRQIGFSFTKRLRQVDLVFDFPDGRLFASGSKIRIRQEPEKAQITYKSSMLANSDVSMRDEVSITIDPTEIDEAVELIARLGYPMLFKLPKDREIFVRENVTVTLDTWPILGLLIEIEGEEHAIHSAANEIAPDLRFANYRLSELVAHVMARTGKDFDALRREAELAWGMAFGHLGLALGMEDGADGR